MKKESTRLIKLLKLQAYDTPEFIYQPDMKKGDLFVIPSQYPYKWILINYGNTAVRIFEEGKMHDLGRGLTHELLHVVMDELNQKYLKNVREKEFDDSLESTIEHLTTILVDLK